MRRNVKGRKATGGCKRQFMRNNPALGNEGGHVRCGFLHLLFARAHGDAHKIKEILPAAPSVEILPLIGADEQDKRHRRPVVFAQTAHRINRVRGPRALELFGADRKRFVLADCRAQHLQAKRHGCGDRFLPGARREHEIDALQTQDTRYPVVVGWQYSFDSGSPDEAQIAFLRDMMGTFADNREGLVYASYTVESIAFNRGDFVGTYGSLFFLAILLSIVFLAAAVLILYYKQISEGYEDQARFEIMQRVGMTKTDIRKSINSQLLLVFFLPLLFAGLHLGFAFPFIHKLLMLFNLTNLKLLIGTTVITFAIYAVFYTLVYRITSNSYYSIVAGAKEEAA